MTKWPAVFRVNWKEITELVGGPDKSVCLVDSTFKINALPRRRKKNNRENDDNMGSCELVGCESLF